MKNNKISGELQKTIKDIVKECEDEDNEWRQHKVKEWKKHEEFWHGIQYIFWSDSDQTWLNPRDSNWLASLTDEQRESVGPFYDFVIDIYKAYGDSIIAALSAQVPAIRFIPDDADSTSDVITAKTYSKISELVQRHNKAKLIFLRALFFLFNGGNVLSYRFTESKPEYGTYTLPVYQDIEQNIPGDTICENCKAVRETNDEPCPECGSDEPPQQMPGTIERVPIKVSEEILPKSRVKVQIMGPLHFKIPRYATEQEEFDYAIIYKENAKAITKYAYPTFSDDIDKESIDNEDRISKSGYREGESETKYLVTTILAWLRPAAYYRSKNKDHIKELLEKYPNGIKVTLVGKGRVFIACDPEKLDDRLSFGKASLSTYFTSDPIGRPLMPIQELRNQLVNLVVDNIEHQNPATYAESDTISFDDYGKFEPLPGYVYKAKSKPGKSLAESFYTETKASLSKEVPFFWNVLNQDGQFTVGAFPSIYGGPSEGKSRTFAEYAASRQMALQRLSIVYSYLLDWWIETIYGCTKMYAQMMVEDEYYSKYDSGSYIKIWIRKSELDGTVGGCEPESADNFPVSIAQKRDLITKLMEMNNQFIDSVLYTPDNARFLQDVLSLNELKIPGESQRIKQVLEINELIKGEPEMTQDGLPIPMSADGQPIVPDQDVDDDQLHIITIKLFLSDLGGLDLKRENPKGYMNCIAHLKMHEINIAKKNMPPMNQPQKETQQ